MIISIVEPVGGHGGMDHYNYGLALGLADNNIEVLLQTSAETEVRHFNGVTTLLTFGNVWKSPNKAVKLWHYLLRHWQAFVTAKKRGATVVHLHFFSFDWLNFLVTVILNRFNFKNILTIHDVSDFRGKGNSWMRAYILKSFDKLIVHNQFSLKELKKFHDRENVAVIPHGNYLHVVQELPYSASGIEPVRLLFFGQIKRVKGLDVLLKAFGKAIKQNSNIELCIAGKVWHDDLSGYQQLIDELNLGESIKAEFKFIPNNLVENYFKKSDVVILPYRQIYQSGVLLLSMSYGRVVIASNLEPFTEIIEDCKTGFIFTSESEQSLADAIIKVVNERETLPKIAAIASLKLKKDFDWKRIGRITKAVYA